MVIRIRVDVMVHATIIINGVVTIVIIVIIVIIVKIIFIFVVEHGVKEWDEFLTILHSQVKTLLQCARMHD